MPSPRLPLQQLRSPHEQQSTVKQQPVAKQSPKPAQLAKLTVQGEVRLLVNAEAANPEWHKYWAVLAGSCLHLYDSPQQPRPQGVVRLTSKSTLAECRSGGSEMAGAFEIRHADAYLTHDAPDGSQPVLLRASSKQDTRRWAEVLRARSGQPPAQAPPLAHRLAALRG